MSGAYQPIRTTAENYGPFPSLDYTYESGVTAVIGENGAGKSYLVNAPAVALFGHTPDGLGLGDLLSNFGGADRMTVTHECMMGGERYRVRRSWSAKGQTLDLEYNWTGDGEEPWTPHTRESIRETQAWIEGLLGFTKETFLASALQLQGAPSFASRGTSRVERCDLLMTGLGLQYEPYRLLAERDRKQADAEAARLQVRLEQAEQELAGMAEVVENDIHCGNAVHHLSFATEHAQEALDDLLDQQRQAEQRTSERRAAEAELAQAEQARLRLREQAAAADIARDSIEATREMLANLATKDELGALQAVYDEERWEYDAREFNRAQLTKTIEALEQQTECPTCHRPFDNLDEVEGSLRLNRHALRDSPPLPIPSDLAVTRAREQVTERARLEERIATWQQTIDAVEDAAWLHDFAMAEALVPLTAEKLAELPPIDQAESDRIQQQTLEARAQVNEQRARLDEARAEKARLEAQLERLQQVEGQATFWRMEREQHIGQAYLAGQMEAMYGRDGIPQLVIESVAVPYLEQQASAILGRLGKPWQVEIHLGKETKQGKVVPALDVKVITESGAVQRYEQCSGGEQCRLDVALHVAFVRLWKQRSGSWSELYAIDEPEGLDASGMAALVDVLDFLGEEFATVMLITHHSELRDSIGQTIQVSRNGRGSLVGAAA